MPGTHEKTEQRVIKKFYDRFKAELDAFAESVTGDCDPGERRSYATVMLTRLMFVSILQANGFLDADYLRARMVESARRGKGRFYREIICPLLFEGFIKKQEDRSLSAQENLGRVPYLGSELFLRHTIERACPAKVDIADAAFNRAIDFFDQHRWRLDDGPSESDSEINANVLGFVLERHVNQKQMGAYYTKDDITDYTCVNTIIPFIFDAARRADDDPFDGDRSTFGLLQSGPDRYIYPSLKTGVESPLRNENALSPLTLPGESSQEAAARRNRYEELCARMTSGEIHRVNDLITYNLDAARFALDAIEGCESARRLSAFWRALEKITVLDPTCGSGAFLFAALRSLEPLYAACLDRMQKLLDKPEQSNGDELNNFRELLRRAGSFVDRRQFILKSIVTNNLFGVDLMEEAVEICKLRLCLKLLAQSEPGDYSEPLLDVHFNIRAGNALVGFIAADKQIDEKERLDNHLARQYAIEPDDRAGYEKWLSSHKPFHWAIEFREVINKGGFDVIIGNPPYVNASEARREYTVKDYQTAGCPDVYAWVLERAAGLLRPEGRTGMIAPLSLSFSGDFDSCRELLFKSYGENWFASFGRIPAALFNFDVRVRNTIHIGHKTERVAPQHTTRLYRWFESARPHLFEMLQYATFTPGLWRNRIPKISAANLARAFEKALVETRSTLALSLASKPTPHALHFKKTAYNWLTFCRKLPPCYDGTGASVPQTKFGPVYFEDAATRDLAFLLLNGKLAFAFWCIVGDDFDVARWMFADFPVDLRASYDCPPHLAD
ncbi:MAG TPA: DNA methyltransferase, partial [Blastocatellia bacterium]